MHWVLLKPTQRHQGTYNSFELQVGPQGPTLFFAITFASIFFGKLKGSGLFAYVIILVSGPWFTPVAGSWSNLVLLVQLT